MSSVINIGVIVFLNPIIILAYLIYFKGNESSFEQVSTNSYRLLLTPYLGTCLLVGTLYLSLMYFFHLKTADSESFIEFLKPTNLYISAFAAFITLITLSTFASKSGMEFNIFAFFIAPILLVAAIALGSLAFLWLYRNMPVPELSSSLTLWSSILLVCFNPLLICFYLISQKQGDASYSGGLEGLLVESITTLIIYGLITVGHYVVFKVIGRTFNLGGFFGIGASLGYTIPFIIGMVFSSYKLTLFYSDVLTRYTSILNPIFYGFLGFGVMLLIVNYIRYIKQTPF